MVRKPDLRHSLPNIFDVAENLPGFYSWPAGLATRRGMRVEEFIQDGQYVLRAEVPGLDPQKDITVEVEQQVLTIRIERREERHDNGRSEFLYGGFSRRIELPQGADENKLKAQYDAGILEITVPLDKKRAESRTIPVESPH